MVGVGEARDSVGAHADREPQVLCLVLGAVGTGFPPLGRRLPHVWAADLNAGELGSTPPGEIVTCTWLPELGDLGVGIAGHPCERMQTANATTCLARSPVAAAELVGGELPPPQPAASTATAAAAMTKVGVSGRRATHDVRFLSVESGDSHVESDEGQPGSMRRAALQAGYRVMPLLSALRHRLAVKIGRTLD